MFGSRTCLAVDSLIGLLRVPQLYCVKLAARDWGIRGQALNSVKMLMLSVALSVTPLPIRYPCSRAIWSSHRVSTLLPCLPASDQSCW